MLYLNFEDFEELFISIFFSTYIKMGQKEPLVEKNRSLKEFYMQLESTTT